MSEPLEGIMEDAARLAAVALAEDGPFDLTTSVVGDGAPEGLAEIRVKRPTVLAGFVHAGAVAALAGITVEWRVTEGIAVDAGPVGILRGRVPAILFAERSFLNLLQRASGIAHATRTLVQRLEGTRCRVLHTRKTAPGLRRLDVAAVLAGGGVVHRLDLARIVMIKDNHWRLLAMSGQTLDEAIGMARGRGAVAIQVEVETEDQVRLACRSAVDRLLIDNQTPATVAALGALARSLRPRIEIEATGGVDFDTARAFAEAGADYVSVGALTHSVRAADISIELL